jgi:hypothetical protein
VAWLVKREQIRKINNVFFKKLDFTSKSFPKIADFVEKVLEILITTLDNGC